MNTCPTCPNDLVCHDQGECLRPTAKRLQEVFVYEPTTGFIKRIVSNRWAKRGSDACKKHTKGYYNTYIDGATLKSHVVAWVLMTGKYPKAQIDHINGNRKDNRWCNLREATNSQNAYNAKRRKDNVSGIKGVFWHSQSKKWTAQITINGKRITIGRYADIEQAKQARIMAANQIHQEYARHE